MGFTDLFKRTKPLKHSSESCREVLTPLMDADKPQSVPPIDISVLLYKLNSQKNMTHADFEAWVKPLSEHERGLVFHHCLSSDLDSLFFQADVFGKLDILMRHGMEMFPDELGRFPFQVLCSRKRYQYGTSEECQAFENKALALLEKTDLDFFFDSLFHYFENHPNDTATPAWQGLYFLIQGHYNQVLETLAQHSRFPEWVQSLDHTSNTTPCLFRTLWDKNVHAFEVLVQHGANPNQWSLSPTTGQPSQSLLHALLFELEKKTSKGGFSQPPSPLKSLSKSSLDHLIFEHLFSLALQYGADPYYEPSGSTLGSPYLHAKRHMPEYVQPMEIWVKYHQDQAALAPLREIDLSSASPSKAQRQRL